MLITYYNISLIVYKCFVLKGLSLWLESQHLCLSDKTLRQTASPMDTHMASYLVLHRLGQLPIRDIPSPILTTQIADQLYQCIPISSPNNLPHTPFQYLTGYQFVWMWWRQPHHLLPYLSLNLSISYLLPRA